ILGLVLVLLLSMPVTAFFDAKLIAHPQMPWWVGRAVEVCSFFLLFSYVPFLSGERRESERTKTLRFALFGALMLTAGIATYRVSPAPTIDVWDLQMR